MKIYHFPYQHDVGDARITGTLLKVSFGVWNEGYADLHPWVKFGDLSLEVQLERLTQGLLSPLLQKSLYFAREDAEGRRQRRSLFSGLALPRSHVLVDSAREAEEKFEEGYRLFKIKRLIDLPKHEGKWRFDLAGTNSFLEFRRWWEGLSDFQRTQVDAVEDPWRGPGEEIHGAPLFSDWILNGLWPNRVIKPAREAGELGSYVGLGGRVYFTHYLDHPLGQAAALWEAGRFYKRHPGLTEAGGFSRVVGREFAAFDDVWRRSGPILTPPSGSGFGFDSQLADLKWERVL